MATEARKPVSRQRRALTLRGEVPRPRGIAHTFPAL
jgi:hypothetical protein